MANIPFLNNAYFAAKVGIGTTSPTQLLHVNSITANPTGIGLQNSQRYYSVRSNNYSLVFTDETVGSERMRITSAGNVGIGETSVDARLHISALASNGISNVKLESPGASKWAFGIPAGQTYFALDDVNDNLTTPKLVVLKTSGNVGIGDTTPSYKLDVAGTIRATGDVIAYSDVRIKENIKTIDNSLEKVSKLRGVEFNKIGDNKKSIGVIAQEIEKVIPEVVKEDDKGMKSVAYGNISGLLIEAIKELKAEIEELKKYKCDCKR